MNPTSRSTAASPRVRLITLRIRPWVWAVLLVGVLLAGTWLGGGDDRVVAPPGEGEGAQPLVDWRIVVDAGHGGEDRGVCHFPDDLIEKEINLDMAFRLQSALEAIGAEVLMTRTDDRFISLDERAEMANRAEADLFISLHVNRIPGHPECFGAQTFFYPGATEAEELARDIQQELLAIDPENYRQIQSGQYKVLRLTEMPGVIVEVAFMTNARDRELLQADEYRTRVTEAIVAGIVRYVERGGPKEASPS